jgi:hypothetical protein
MRNTKTNGTKYQNSYISNQIKNTTDQTKNVDNTGTTT